MTSKNTNKAKNVTATNEQNKDREKEKKKLRESHFTKNVEHIVFEEICPLSHTAANSKISEGLTSTQVETLKKSRPMHGTGFNIAKSKIELGKQWHQHLQDKAKREIIKQKRYDDILKKKEELLQLKKKTN